LDEDFLDFFSYLFIGFTLWRIILSSVTDANGLFSHTYNSLLKNVSLHPFILCIASSYKNIVTLLLNMPIIFFVLVINGEFYFSSLIYFFIFMILFFISNICVTFIFSILCLRFRDLEHTISVFFGILFFFTPIIWSIDQLGDKVFLIQPNILYHYVEFFRSGLKNGYVDLNTILIVSLFTFFLTIFSIFLSKKFKNKINYWVD